MEHVNGRKFTEKKREEENQSGAWCAEAVDRAVIKNLKKCRVLKNSTDGGQGEICTG